MKNLVIVTVLLMVIGGSNSIAAMEKTINIAHRGACAYLPEHTLPAKALAYKSLRCTSVLRSEKLRINGISERGSPV